MYRLPYFTEHNEETVKAFMREHNFATLVSNDDPYPAFTQIPLIIEETGDGMIFEGHMMRNTDHHKAFMKNPGVVAIFHGPHCYVSASWYEEPGGSTWNYMNVYAKGKLTFYDDDERTRAALKKITDKYEGPGKPSSFENLPDDYVKRLSVAVVCFQIKVESIENVFKLSQNHHAADQENIIRQLEMREDAGSHAIAKEMKLRLK